MQIFILKLGGTGFIEVDVQAEDTIAQVLSKAGLPNPSSYLCFNGGPNNPNHEQVPVLEDRKVSDYMDIEAVKSKEQTWVEQKDPPHASTKLNMFYMTLGGNRAM
eukprot:TRINITY_DN59105_c0_g1_i1.p2 TRINITY_DN59105_c0_g1~~TRINITY_DN59105_c0_g1_i1.p2  ORF type:complete len:105 (-),score=15.05 TRINITY_DN59105_c0_g1_i1:78-392(-)